MIEDERGWCVVKILVKGSAGQAQSEIGSMI
jgi:hypothetical protein